MTDSGGRSVQQAVWVQCLSFVGSGWRWAWAQAPFVGHAPVVERPGLVLRAVRERRLALHTFLNPLQS